MKYAKSHSLRTQEAVARFGPSARHPVCLAALDFWRQHAELLAQAKALALREEDVSSAEQLREKARALIQRIRDEQKGKEARDVSALLRTIDEHLRKAQKWHHATVRVCAIHHELCAVTLARFESECDAVTASGNDTARRALQRVRKRWLSEDVLQQARDHRSLAILEAHRDKAIKGAWAKGGPSAGYFEAAFVGGRELSDDVLAGRLTNRELHAHLVAAGVAAPGDIDAKETRRLAKKLGILLADDQRGRKRKPFALKPKRICPYCSLRELEPWKQQCRSCAIRPTYIGGDSLEHVELIKNHQKPVLDSTVVTVTPPLDLWKPYS